MWRVFYGIGFLCLAFMGVGAFVGADEKANPFPLGIYWPWERLGGHAQKLGVDKWQLVAQRLEDLKKHHVDTIWVVNMGIADLGRLAAECAQRDIRLIPALGELHYAVPWRRNNWEYFENQSKAALAAAGENPAILAWALCDEPRKDIVAEMELYRQKFHQWGAKQPAVVVTMHQDTPTYAREAGFPFVCTDLYPFFSDGNPNGPNPAPVSRQWYRRKTEETVRAALENGRLPWIMPQMYTEVWGPWKYDEKGELIIMPGGILNWRAPTVGEIRWQIWSALGLGAQGILFFVYESPVTDAPTAQPYVGELFPERMKATEEKPLHMPAALLRPDGSPTPQYEAMAEIFAILQKEELSVLRGAKPVDLWPVQISAPGWIGLLRNENKLFYVVVNDDTEAAQELTIAGLNKTVRDLRTGAVLQLQEGRVRLRLDAGDGTVLLEEP